jgi:hypothetical protein
MTLKEWQERPELAVALREELNKTIWQAALSVLENMSFARKFSDMQAPAISATGTALAGQILGYSKCQRNLELLAMPPETAKQQIAESYGITDPTQATE